MYGAILGDMIGAPYEFDRGSKTKTFPMFTDKSQLETHLPMRSQCVLPCTIATAIPS